jgi:hypothetical protein
MKETKRMINEIKSSFFEKRNRIHKPLAKLKEREDPN